jgi:hypothetical protein
MRATAGKNYLFHYFRKNVRLDDFCKKKFVRKNNFAKFRLLARMFKKHFNLIFIALLKEHCEGFDKLLLLLASE